MKKALVILSGGQDSTTCLFWAKKQYDEVHAITFDYGQKHIIEIESAIKVAEMAGVKSHEIVSVPNCLVSASPLTSDNSLDKYEDFESMENEVGNKVEKTFVPMRNTFFFVVAMNRAVSLGCNVLVTGICQEDNANYPDCTEAFRKKFEDMANESLGTDAFEVVAPLMFLSKAETVKLSYDLPQCWEAMAYTHTSYDGKYPPTDNNHANILRAHGFEEAGLPDPLVLRAHKEGLMELPKTKNYSNIII
mgnify:CR=1 FL=1